MISSTSLLEILYVVHDLADTLDETGMRIGLRVNKTDERCPRVSIRNAVGGGYKRVAIPVLPDNKQVRLLLNFIDEYCKADETT